MTKLTKHEKADKVKWAFTVIAFVLAFVLLLGIALQVFSPVGNRPTDWFEEIGKVEENPDEVQDDGQSETASLDGNEVEKIPAAVQDDTQSETASLDGNGGMFVTNGLLGGNIEDTVTNDVPDDALAEEPDTDIGHQSTVTQPDYFNKTSVDLPIIW